VPELPPQPPNPYEAALRRGQGSAPPPLPPAAISRGTVPFSSNENRSSPLLGDVPSWWQDEGRLEASAWLLSFVIHAVALVLLGLITFNAQTGNAPLRLLAASDDGDAAPGRLDRTSQPEEPDRHEGDSTKVAVFDAAPLSAPVAKPEIVLHKPNASPSKIDAARPPAVGNPATSGGTTGAAGGGPAGGGWEGRNPNGRGEGIGRYGGSKKSEAAVERGLGWLVAHQREDGSWCFDLSGPPCNGKCRNAGSAPSTTAATGLALLAFLGAGHTHLDGEHQEVVSRGLAYLKNPAQAVPTPHGIDLRSASGNSGMYGQAIATIALCEAYGMTHDETLKDVAQGAIRFIEWAQHKEGGWRYGPGDPGDTSVTGWQVMALRSGQLAKLEVDYRALLAASKFLDTMQYSGKEDGIRTKNGTRKKIEGIYFRYMHDRGPDPVNDHATTAVGWLCRMYTRGHDRRTFYPGVNLLHHWGPSKPSWSTANMYYNFYATQVLFHWGGQEWEDWNVPMRNYLIATQATGNYENGSWHFDDVHGDVGGRLYNTALAILILEVYYRHMPLYHREAAQGRI
jgi:hypothetical protein